MELVYLWVEEYKNIRNQGFNFSPRFECEFFPEYNENGILKNDCELKITPKDYVSIFPENINITAIVGENGSGKSSILELLPYGQKVIQATKLIFLLFKKANDYILFTNNKEKIKHLENLKVYIIKDLKEISEENNIKVINYDTDFTKENFSDKDILKYLENNIRYGFSFKEQYLEKNNKIFNLEKYKHISNWLIYFLIKELVKLNSFFKPTYIKISNQNRTTTDLRIENIIEDLEKIKNGNIKSDEININKLINELKENQFLKTLKYNQKIFIDDLNKIEILFELPIQDYFYIDFYNEKNINFSEFSQGERNFYIHFLFLMYLNKNHSNSKEKENTFFLIDEPDTTFHPNWQKKYIKNLINIFNNYKKNIHFIITSHSPFLLSDIPKENIIFLEKGIQKYPFKENEQTFGANIHTLLSNGFFMSNGLMGEFAKSKINEAIDNLHEKSQSLSQKQIKSIIDSIGEPFLQIKLEQMYKEKFGLDDEIEELEKRQEEINLKIKQLKKQKTENAKS